MKFKEESSNKYRVQFKRATEALINEMTVDEFIEYLENNETLKVENCEHVNGIKRCRVYSLKETDELHKIFLVTDDGRLFYYKSLLEKAELVDEEKTDKKAIKEKIKSIIEQIEEESEYAAADFEAYMKEINNDWEYDSEYDDFFFKGLNRAKEIIIKTLLGK